MRKTPVRKSTAGAAGALLLSVAFLLAACGGGANPSGAAIGARVATTSSTTPSASTTTSATTPSSTTTSSSTTTTAPATTTTVKVKVKLRRKSVYTLTGAGSIVWGFHLHAKDCTTGRAQDSTETLSVRPTQFKPSQASVPVTVHSSAETSGTFECGGFSMGGSATRAASWPMTLTVGPPTVLGGAIPDLTGRFEFRSASGFSAASVVACPATTTTLPTPASTSSTVPHCKKKTGRTFVATLAMTSYPCVGAMPGITFTCTGSGSIQLTVEKSSVSGS